MIKQIRSFRHRVFQSLFTEHWPKHGLSLVNTGLITLVLISILSAILETESTISGAYGPILRSFNIGTLYLFSIEYAARVWSAGELEKYKGIKGRLRYIITPMAIIDLLTILPLWFGAGAELVLVRLMRIARIIKLARIPGISKALRSIVAAVAKRKFELLISLGATFLFMLVSATVLYLVERNGQPVVFGSIPRALWWGMATLTTVGYGDVYPLTPLGKIFAGIFAISGIGLAALPAGIFAAAFTSIYQTDDDKDHH